MMLKPLLRRITLATLIAAPTALGAQAAGQKQPPKTTPGTNTPEVHLARAQAAFVNQRLAEAEHEYRAALALDPRLTVRARFPLAVVLFGLQKRAEARQEFDAVRSQTGDDPNVTYYLGRLDLMDGKLDSAIHNLTLAATAPPFPDTYAYLGSAYLKRADLDSAEKWLKKAVALTPRDPVVQTRLGNLYQAEGARRRRKRLSPARRNSASEIWSPPSLGLSAAAPWRRSPSSNRAGCARSFLTRTTRVGW